MPSSRAERAAGLLVEPFRREQALPLVQMWRASFEYGVGVRDPNPIEDQVTYLFDKVLPANGVHVAMRDGEIVGFIAFNAESVAQLHVRVERIGQGIGSHLLRRAQAASSGSLWLYTFARNRRARAFYEHHGFVAVAEGFEPTWQLADVKYCWFAEGAGAA
jgi:ribosomal protein S18 acetylase RimI-like enzyme